MGSISLESVQKLLHLDVPDPQFAAYEVSFEFMVDSVLVKAISYVSWRTTEIRIIDPFAILAWDSSPPLFALGVMRAGKKFIQERDGTTDLDEYIKNARVAYSRHVTYLRLKTEIDSAQEDFLCVFREDILLLETIYSNVTASVATDKIRLRQLLKSHEIDKKQYQAKLKLLSSEAFDASYHLTDLKRQVQLELDDIKRVLIDQGLLLEQSSSA